MVQAHPSAAVFPGPQGEGLAADVQARAVAAVREWDARVTAESWPENAVWLACSHGDVIKALLADALGLHLDLFQRIVVDPCSVSVVRYTETRPFVLRANDTGGDVAALLPPKKKPAGAGSEGDADGAVGGGAGPDAAVGGGAVPGVTPGTSGGSGPGVTDGRRRGSRAGVISPPPGPQG